MRSLLLCLSVLLYLSGHAQTARISNYVMNIIEHDADKETVKMLAEEKAKNPHISEAVQKFATDTFRINYLWKRKLEFVPGREGRVSFAMEALDLYKDLLSKHYAIAIQKVKSSDKAALEADQKKWQDEYDELEKQLSGDKYEMYKVKEYEVGLVKDRVTNMFQYTQGLK